MQLVNIMGFIAASVTVIYSGFGLPVQFIRNYKQKSTKGLSLLMMSVMFISFSCWVVYASVEPQPDWYIIVPNSLGAIGSLLILFQFAIYRKVKD